MSPCKRLSTAEIGQLCSFRIHALNERLKRRLQLATALYKALSRLDMGKRNNVNLGRYTQNVLLNGFDSAVTNWDKQVNTFKNFAIKL